jgi:hypothetical protein
MRTTENVHARKAVRAYSRIYLKGTEQQHALGEEKMKKMKRAANAKKESGKVFHPQCRAAKDRERVPNKRGSRRQNERRTA